MNWAKTLKTISNSIYIVGVVIVLCLGTISLFGSNETIDTTAMIPFTWKEQAFIWLALGTIPMLLACMAVYKFNAIKDKTQKKEKFHFHLFPGIYLLRLCTIRDRCNNCRYDKYFRNLRGSCFFSVIKEHNV